MAVTPAHRDAPLRLTREQVRRVDCLAIERYHMTGLVLMENAGRRAAELIDASFGPAGRVLIVCGAGNNGGDGCVIARHLHNRGWLARVVVAGEAAKMSDNMQANFRIAEAMGLVQLVSTDPTALAAAVAQADGATVIIDALLGTGFAGAVRPPMDRVIAAINAAPRRAVVAVDIPSGMDCDTGEGAVVIRAELTVTFVAEKAGFATPSARSLLGRVEVADIGAPRELIAAIAAGTV
jgi:NAD(P)H-hydrate epimerase